MRYNKLVPELTVSNLSKSLDFYVNIMGFKVEYDRKEKKFAFLSLEGSQLMIEEGKDNPKSRFYVGPLEYPLGRGLHFQIEVKDVSKVLESLAKHNYPLKSKLEDSWFRNGKFLLGMRNFLVQDPDGYLLMFHQDLGKKAIK